MFTSTTTEYYCAEHHAPNPASKLKDTGCTFVVNEVSEASHRGVSKLLTYSLDATHVYGAAQVVGPVNLCGIDSANPV